ncbi:hypothetical protein [Malacoplasma muris]|uniref:hypothetical protein n=1 Tax=Malacoplasma muris TaxID=2119 RepID=UPI00398E3660
MKKNFSIIFSTLTLVAIPIIASSCSSSNNMNQENNSKPVTPDNTNPPTNGGDLSDGEQNKPPVNTEPIQPNPNPKPPVEQPDKPVVPPINPDALPPIQTPPVDPTPPDNENLPIDQQIYNAMTLLPVNDSGYDYRNIYTKDFVKFGPFNAPETNYKSYLRINEEELRQKFGNEMKDYTNFNFTFLKYENDRFDFNYPSTIKFQILFDINNVTHNKTININGFKVNPDWWGLLDRQPITNLVTPDGCTSYKGKLEKFKISELMEISENKYKELLDKTTKEDIRLNYMYQVRFGMYQMFSDNFSEINYYIKNETQEGFIAVAEGIIKEDKTNFKWAIQPHTATMSGRTSVKAGDKVIYEIESYNNFNKPTFISNDDNWGDFTKSWYWDFSDNCEDLKNTNNPLYVRDVLFRDNWTLSNKVHVRLFINNVNIYNSGGGISQWNFYNFVLKKRLRL